MKRLCAIALVIASCPACVVVYAPHAQRAAVQIHEQSATNMVVNETVPVEPRLANELTGAVGIRGNVGSGNTVASPSAKVGRP